MATRNNNFRRLGLALFLAIGAGVVWGLMFGFSFSVIRSMTPCTMTPSDDCQESLLFTQDGSAMIQATKNGVISYRTVDGDPITRAPDDRIDLSYLHGPVNLQKRFFRQPWSERIGIISNNASPEKWFLVYDGNLQGHVYMVGYDKYSKAKIGYLGRNGFCRHKPLQEEQFAVDGQIVSQANKHALITGIFSPKEAANVSYLLTKEGLVKIIPQKRTVKLLQKDADLVSINARPDLLDFDKENGPGVVLLRKCDRVQLLDTDGHKLRTYLLPEKLRDATIKFLPLKDGTALVRKGLYSPQAELFWIDTAGKILKYKDLLKPVKSSHTKEAFLGSVCIPVTGIYGGVLVGYPWGALRNAESLGYWAALSELIQIWWPGLLFMGTLSVVAAILCYRRQRKYGLEWTWVWVGFVFLLGVPGFLGYLAHRRWPARLPCPNCNNLAPRDREACISCHQKFPEPAPKGTEVFA